MINNNEESEIHKESSSEEIINNEYERPNLEHFFVEEETLESEWDETPEIPEEDVISEVEADGEDDISFEDQQQEHEEAYLETLRREVNTLENLVSNSSDAKKFANCLESIFGLEIQFELAWSFVIKRMQYKSLLGQTVISLDDHKLNSLRKDLSKIRRINTLIILTRALGSHSLESRLVEALISKEFGIQTNAQNDVLSKLEKLLEEYADKVKDTKI